MKMRVTNLTLVVLGISVLAAIASPVRVSAKALDLHPALEVEGGSGAVIWTGDYTENVESKWRSLFGIGVTVGGDPQARFAVRTGLFYRASGSRLEVTDPDFPGYRLRATDRWSSLRAPVRLSWALQPGGHWVVEGGVAGRWLLQAKEKLDMQGPTLIRRTAHSGAVIFETLDKEQDVTDGYRRGDVAWSAGLGWRGHAFGRQAMLTARFEQGLYDVMLDNPNADARERMLSLGAGIAW